MEEQERQFKGIWIPSEIWLAEELSLQEKVVLVEIDSLEDKEKGCYASNKYFANFFKLSPGRISQIITNLIDKDYIDVKYITKGKEIKERQIRIKRPPYPLVRKLNTYLENNDRGIKKTKEGYLENAKENNISINNINNITINDDDNKEDLIDFLQKNGFVLNDILYDVVKEWEDNELTRYAIKKAVLNNKYNINYIQKILYSYEKNNIKSVQEAIEQDEEFNIKKDLYYKNKYKTKETRYEREQRIMEEWAKDEQD